MLGTRLATIVLAVTDDRMLADFTGAVFAGAGVSCHEFDSSVVVVKTQLSSHALNRDRPFPILTYGVPTHGQ
jgi:hypothetical protein